MPSATSDQFAWSVLPTVFRACVFGTSPRNDAIVRAYRRRLSFCGSWGQIGSDYIRTGPDAGSGCICERPDSSNQVRTKMLTDEATTDNKNTTQEGGARGKTRSASQYENPSSASGPSSPVQ